MNVLMLGSMLLILSKEQRCWLQSRIILVLENKNVSKTANNKKSAVNTSGCCQQLCTHPDLKKTHKADTGNYDPSANRYWVEFECPDCGKKWVEEQ